MVLYKSIDEALSARLDLVERLQSIEVQLATRAAAVVGQSMTTEDYKAYLEWRARALSAKVKISGRLSRTKAAINAMRRKRAETRLNSGGADGLLSDAYSLLKSLVSEGAQITEEEQALIDDISAYIQSQV